ncbi:type II secretion system F family protein [Streptomyces sp. SID1034]|uniref:type II secretion system F family protein n=1 Tax=Streptomyces sp. SID1034 TaxID=2690248 RepID=UPI0013695788|nr:type II secretion system F family protein [Streptomyces sp. SID1034]MYV88833.1 type II secretion system F family protein [Streptomyces sp. SID1034]
MATFKYVALAPDGKRATGVLTGSSVDGVTDNLTRQGYDVQSVKASGRNLLQLELTAEKVDLVELSNFSRQMGAFIKAGVPILDALEIIRAETKDKKLGRVLVDVMDSLRFGESFAVAMAAHTTALPPFYMSVLRSAEATGELDVVMAQLARYIERDVEGRRSIRSALTYPGLVMGLALAVVLVLVIFVLPRFKVFFDSFHAELPLPTRILLGFTDFVTVWYPLIVGVLVALVAALIAGLRTERGRVLRDRFLLATPVVGDVVRFMVIERFCRILTSMIKAGVPIPEALSLAGSGTNNLVYERSIRTARTEMLEGGGISRPMARTKLFPGAVTQMMRVGEETGTLDDQLENVSEFYEKELQHKLKRMTSLFEPTVVIMVGVVVGFVAVALISAIYGVYNQVNVQ